VFLYQTENDHAFPTEILGNVQQDEPLRTIPLPTAFFEIEPVSRVAFLLLPELSFHVPEPLYDVAKRYTNAEGKVVTESGLDGFDMPPLIFITITEYEVEANPVKVADVDV
jgi:hypothetical protein